ncbi:hypothetical protein DMH02_010325 [Streptomyces sp. WAC 00631]|uniref:hypothetical protein n=1 Tax=unclassified Streptomyces TaxID=2593676 RepID=UPI000F792EB6|nr:MULTISPECIES: hypothetical protein [unclassified Streptomyces]MCC5033606.1 hypothetical protein [Streptomyces sp. WAC 00631]MCC9743000.1 hypothetical protein [Streptomyces sp. MNU89]
MIRKSVLPSVNARHSLGALAVAGVLAASVAAAPSASAAPERADVSVYVWATNVNVRNSYSSTCDNYPSRANCATVTRVSATWVNAWCQTPGETINDSGYSSRWWTFLQAPNGTWGWVSNVYIRGEAHLSNVPDCA